MPSSLTMLLPSALGFSPHPPVSVYGTGVYGAIAAFLGGCSVCFATSVSLHFTRLLSPCGLPCMAAPVLVPVFPFPAHILPPRPRSSVHIRYRNLCLLSIGYASLPRLRSRLPQGRSALPWKPWIFGRGDSHPPLATHSGILPSHASTAPHGRGFAGFGNAPLPMRPSGASRGFGGAFEPRTFSARGLSTSELLRTL